MNRSYTLKSNQVFFFCFLFFLLFMDMINGFLTTNHIIGTGGLSSPSQIGRILALVFVLLYFLNHKANFLWFFLALYLISVEFFSGIIFDIESSGIAYGFVNSYKLVYIFLVSSLLLLLVKNKDDLVHFLLYFKWHLYVVVASLFFGVITGLGTDTYTGGGLGTKGFFASGNGLGLYLGISTLFIVLLRRLEVGRYLSISIVGVIFLCLGTVLVGTKTAIIFSVLSLIVLVFNSRFKWLFITFICFLFLFFSVRIYSLFETAFSVLVLRYNNSENLFYFLGSGRIQYVVDAFNTLLSQDWVVLRILFGGGSYLSYQNPNFILEFDTLETDLFDVLFMYGIVGVSLYLFFFLRLLRMCLIKIEFFMIGILLIGHSIIAGHVIFNGMSSFFIVILYVFVSKYHLVESYPEARA